MATCQELASQIKTVKSELQHVVDPDAQADLDAQLRDLLRQQRDQGCLGPPQPSSDLRGTVITSYGHDVLIDPELPPFPGNIQLISQAFRTTTEVGLQFPQHQNRVLIIASTTQPIPTDGNRFNDIGVGLVLNGTVDLSTGSMEMDAHLDIEFPNSANFPIVGSDREEADLVLSTSTGAFIPIDNSGRTQFFHGSPVDAAGNITLVGTGRYTRGQFAGQESSWMVIQGQFSPWPPVILPTVE